MTTKLSADPPAEPASSTTGAGLGRRRLRALTIWTVAFVAGWLLIGLPTDPLYAFFWLWAVTLAWNSHLPWRHHVAFARDWLPVVLLLTVYNFSRGFADNFAEPHVRELINADLWMFGQWTDGKVPTVWLQDRLYVGEDVIRWYDIAIAWVYFSHFFLSLGAAVTLWLTSRPLWAKFMRRWFALSAAGLATYFIYPAAPPWWAAEYGYLADEVYRISTRGWHAFGLHGAGNLLNLGQYASNPVAAIPSLHTAFALFVVLFFLPRVSRWWWPLMLTYPLAMTFTLVYAGEHYIIDVLIGWAYVVAVFLLVGLGERWWARRRAAADAGPAGSSPEAGVDGSGPEAGAVVEAPGGEPAGDRALPVQAGPVDAGTRSS